MHGQASLAWVGAHVSEEVRRALEPSDPAGRFGLMLVDVGLPTEHVPSPTLLGSKS